MTGKVVNFEPGVGKRLGSLRLEIGSRFDPCGCGVLGSVLAVECRETRIQQLLEDGASKADRDPSSASSARTPIWTSTTIPLVSTLKNNPPIEPQDVSISSEELSASV